MHPYGGVLKTMKKENPGLLEYIKNEEQSILESQREYLKNEIVYLEIKIDKLQNKSVTPFGDKVAESFPMGRVGFMGGKGAKKMSREFDKNIEKAKTLSTLDLELRTLKNRLKIIDKGTAKIFLKTWQVIESFIWLSDLLSAYDNVIETGILKGDVLDAKNLGYVREDRKQILKKYNARIKKYTLQYEESKK